MARIPAADVDSLDADTTYAALYIDNLRTGAAHQFALLSGEQARTIVARSTAPTRLVFVDAR